MKLLYAPWRSNYITSNNGPDHPTTGFTCVFCKQFTEQLDEQNFILKRFKHCVVLLNLHPYNPGHLLILPYTHQSHLHNLTEQERTEIMEIASKSIELLEKELACDGVNMGMNIGKASGGSIPEHLHIHLVPRWWGDTNFLAAVANTKQIPFDLHEMYRKLSHAYSVVALL